MLLNWLKQPPVVVLTIALVALVSVREISRQESGQHDASQAVTSQVQQSRSLGSSNDAMGPIVVPPRASEPDREEWRRERSVEIQRDMLQLSLVMLLVSSIGVVVVVATLKATRDAVDEARRATDVANRSVDEQVRIGEAQTRAYISVDMKSLPKTLGFYSTHHGRFNLKNAGQSPALNARVQCGIVPHTGKHPSDPDELYNKEGEERASRVTISAGDKNATDLDNALGPDGAYTIQQWQSWAGMAHNLPLPVMLIVGVWYDDVFEKPRETKECFIANPTGLMEEDGTYPVDWVAYHALYKVV